MTQNELITLLEKSLKYTPIVYKQSLFTQDDEFGNEFTLEFKHTDIPDDSLLFFVPSISANENGNCKLIVKIPYAQADGSYAYTPVTYNIVVEQNDDLPRPAVKGDIVANRLCIFRFRQSTGNAILLNSPLYNDATFSTLKVTNASFLNKPVWKDATTGVDYVLISMKDFAELELRVQKLEQKIRFGTEDPETALSGAPSGTIYFQHEEE